MRYPLFISLSIAVLATMFAFQNLQYVRVRFLTFDLDGRLALVILITLALGVFIGYMGSLPKRWKARGEINSLKKKVQDLEAEAVAPLLMETPAELEQLAPPAKPEQAASEAESASSTK